MSDLNAEQLDELKTAFSEIDADGNGIISVDEIDILLLKMGLEVPIELLEEAISDIDIDGDGSVSFDEFVEVVKSLKDEVIGDLRASFNHIDSDGDGFINHEELKAMMKSIGDDLPDEEIDKMIKEADLDNDNKVSFDEFVRMME